MTVAQFAHHCCGCGECVAICPTTAITMRENENGFCYPHVDVKKCINCSKCEKHCAFNKREERNVLLSSYAVKHKDEHTRAQSRSGGIFTAISDWFLDNGGVVYGCKLVGCTQAVHARATTKQERDAFRGSKYIQSQMETVFNSVKTDLVDGLWVLFTGTPCQVNAVKDYCADIDCEKLLLLDIVCHGVPSPKVWKDYVKFREKAYKKRVVAVDFRDKKQFGWAAHQDTLVFDDQTSASADIFTKLFYDHYIIRKECFSCPFKNLQRAGDISIADCWGIAQNYPFFDDNNGVSLVLVNTEKGKTFFAQTDDIDTINVDISKLMQPPLEKNWDMPANYEEFWQYYQKNSFARVLNTYVYNIPTPNIIQRVFNKAKQLLKNCLRNNIRR